MSDPVSLAPEPLAAQTLLPVNPLLGVVLLTLLLVAATVATLARLTQDSESGYGRAILVAGLRAVVQLGAVALVIGWVVGALPMLLGFLALMFAVAAVTAGRRVTDHRSWWLAALPIAAGVVPVIVLLLVTGLVPLRGIALIPIAGILMGGAMTATALGGRRALEELSSRRGEVEAGLALGLPPRDAVLEVARPAAAGALLPGLDQTRTVGLVTLPGAFVGMLLGGASPVMAGAVQLFVLVALLLVQTVAVAVTLELIASGRLRRQEPAAG